MSDADLASLAEYMGILPWYLDSTGTRHDTGPETARALLRAMGETTERPDRRLGQLYAAQATRYLPQWLVVEADAPTRLPERAAGLQWSLDLEDGSRRSGRGPEMEPLPLGIHRLRYGGNVCWILSAPARLPWPERGWGVTLPLYGLRTAEQGGIGSYADLATALASLGRHGADFVGVNPIHAGFPTDPEAFSPYSPSSRRRLSTQHIHTDAPVPAGDALIDYAEASPRHLEALEQAWAASGPDPDFDAWRAAEGEPLERFALHQALAEVHGPYWPDWPPICRTPDAPEIVAFAEAHRDRVDFHAWLQYRAERQLAEVRRAGEEAGMRYGLYLDLAVGTNPGGAETWADPTLFAQGVSLGAPPDAFSADGQTWGLAPLNPHELARRGFRPLAEILRAQLRYAKLLRIDHILGFDRAFWQPAEDGVPGGYVRMPKEALLAVARIEAARAGATIIGEDLGNIPDGLQEDLSASGILGCRVAVFERDWDAGDRAFRPAGEFAEAALTSFATHDLPTLAGWRVARDIDWRERLGSLDAEQAAAAREGRALEVAALDATVGGARADSMHAFLGATPSRLVAVQIEDILGLEEQPNLPGTIHDHPNWRRRLPVDAKSLGDDERVARTAAILKDAGR